MQTLALLIPENHWLRERRERLFPSQRAFGLTVFRLLGVRITGRAAQRRVSYWEAGQHRPSEVELRAIAEVLGVRPEEVRNSFSPCIKVEIQIPHDELRRLEPETLITAVVLGNGQTGSGVP